MKRKSILHFLFVILLISLFSCESFNFNLLPNYPNKINLDGTRQGKWLYFFDKTWQETSNRREAYFYRIVTYKDGKPQGFVKDYYISGELQMEALLIEEEPTYHQGESRWYYQNGQIKSDAYFKDNQYHGRVTHYYEDGQLKAQTDYSRGKKMVSLLPIMKMAN